MGAIIFVVMLVAVYAALIVPQQRRVKNQRHLIAALEEGDVVLTSSGIYGVITEIDGGDIYIEVAEGIELKMTKTSIAGKIRTDKDAPSGKDHDRDHGKDHETDQSDDDSADKTPIAKDGAKGR
jgi:preprotein translocase subunit YajC